MLFCKTGANTCQYWLPSGSSGNTLPAPSMPGLVQSAEFITMPKTGEVYSIGGQDKTSSVNEYAVEGGYIFSDGIWREVSFLFLSGCLSCTLGAKVLYSFKN